jgi:hypothetical protein
MKSLREENIYYFPRGWISTQRGNLRGKRVSRLISRIGISWSDGKRRGWSQLTETRTSSSHSGPDTAGCTNGDQPDVTRSNIFVTCFFKNH